VSYLACAQKLLGATGQIYPQFATHNAQTLATIYTWAQAANVQDYEFQCLHGMGETLYDEVVGASGMNRPCRIYAPVGSHETLLAYLVRRLLENGANSSFVNQIVDPEIPVDALVADPVVLALRTDGAPHAGIAAPQDLFGVERKNSSGLDLSSDDTLRDMCAALAALEARQWNAAPLLANVNVTDGQVVAVTNPARRADIVGRVIEASAQEVAQALDAADAHAPQWAARPPAERAALLLRGADTLEQNRIELIALALREAGKTLANANAEVREAVDFLRYYAAQIRSAPDAPPLGTVVCISPWNFPLAIFLGQIAAALAAGNVVLAKPAEQTPLIAHRAVQLLQEAGIPRGALQFLPGRGETVGAALVADPRVRGVIFTGSLEVAQIINRMLARRALNEGREIPFIAETGGQNAMIVDSSALPEQVVQDVLASAFNSAGQRCSALRLLCLQSDIAEHTLAMLRGAMEELRIGDPARLDTDVGPVIDEEARAALQSHIVRCASASTFQLPLPAECAGGSFVAPTLIELTDLSGLQREVFGPVLHVLRFQRDGLLPLVDSINALGYGLTLGVHSRIEDTVDAVTARAHVGNIYVNRNMVGAVVGVQPFGGEGKSGTGPKAGGPWYLRRLQREENPPPGLDVARLLPGPTGELNTLMYAPRGTILCAGSTVAALLHQLAAVVASGNAALMSNEAASLLPADLSDAMRRVIRRVSVDEIDDIEIGAALTDAASMPRLLPQMAARKGALVTVIETHEEVPVPLWRLLVERAVCVNTTAAGGNASLMVMRDAV
jgi:RHH-type proline utilization regulon transcriptional repressor/proline dehydrogenase/delta 1-pyrroline-5-carboxylate dehydrogenase